RPSPSTTLFRSRDRAHDLQPRSGGGVPERGVAGAQRRPVSRARGRHPEVAQPGPAEVLHESGPDQLDDLDHRGTNLTSVPAASRVGGAAATSNRVAEVRPSSRQPPGDERGYTAA